MENFLLGIGRMRAGDQQVGIVGVGDMGTHAMLWTGTAESAIDLHPAMGFTTTISYDTNGRQQVGQGVGSATGGMTHALLWNGSNVAEDLHRFLPPSAINSYAMGIDDVGTIVGAAGYGDNDLRAVMWIPVPEPAGCAVVLLPAALLARHPRRRLS